MVLEIELFLQRDGEIQRQNAHLFVSVCSVSFWKQGPCPGGWDNLNEKAVCPLLNPQEPEQYLELKKHFLKNKFIFYLFIFGCVGSLLLRRAFSSCSEQGLLFVVLRGLLTAVASLVVEHGLQACVLQQLWFMGSVVVVHGLQSAGSVVVGQGPCCSSACGIFPDQGLNPCPLHWQADSQRLHYQGSPSKNIS